MADKLLHDLNVLGENTEELFRASEGKLAEKSKEKFLSGLERVKGTCRRLQEQTAASGGSAAIKDFPYATMGIVFGLGMLMGVLVRRSPAHPTA